MGLLTLGLLRGASQQYVRSKEAEAAQEAQIAAEKRAQERQKEIIGIQEENARFAAGRQQFFNEQMEQNRQMFQTALQEQNNEAQRRLLGERIELEQTAKIEAKEQAIIQTFGYIAEDGDKKGEFVGPDYVGKKRLPDATEMPIELQRRVQAGIPTILPPILGTIPGLDNLIKANNSVSKGLSGIAKGTLGADPDYNSGFFTMPVTLADGSTKETLIRIPAVNESKGDAKKRAMANSTLVMQTLEDNPDLIPQIIQEYKLGDYGNYNTLVDALKVNGGNALREATKLAQTEGKDMVIQNPIDFYGLLTHVKGKQNQDWFSQTVLAPVLGYSIDTMKVLMGDPSEIDYTYDQVNNRIIRPNPEDWKWSTEYDSDQERFVMKKDVFKQVQEISSYNGVPNHIILGLVKDHKNPLLALKDIAETRTELENGVFMSNGVLQITKRTKELVREKLTENNFDTAEDEILYIRNLIKDNPAGRPSSVAISAQGDIAPKFNNRKNTYQIDGKQAAKMEQAARRAQVIADRMLVLRSEGLGGVGLIASVRRTVGGAMTIVDALTELAATYSMEPDVAARFAENAKLLQEAGSLDKIDMESEIKGQKVFDLLGEQLAFAMAAAVQQGEGGRAISDTDVQNQRLVLGLRGVLSADVGVEENLKYISEEMGRTALINGQYAKAIDDEDFKAVYIYDQSNPRSRTIDALLKGAPRNLKDALDDKKITPESNPDEFRRIPNRDGRTYRLIRKG